MGKRRQTKTKNDVHTGTDITHEYDFYLGYNADEYDSKEEGANSQRHEKGRLDTRETVESANHVHQASRLVLDPDNEPCLPNANPSYTCRQHYGDVMAQRFLAQTRDGTLKLGQVQDHFVENTDYVPFYMPTQERDEFNGNPLFTWTVWDITARYGYTSLTDTVHLMRHLKTDTTEGTGRTTGQLRKIQRKREKRIALHLGKFWSLLPLHYKRDLVAQFDFLAYEPALASHSCCLDTSNIRSTDIKEIQPSHATERPSHDTQQSGSAESIKEYGLPEGNVCTHMRCRIYNEKGVCTYKRKR
jgi:hypothetical protein